MSGIEIKTVNRCTGCNKPIPEVKVFSIYSSKCWCDKCGRKNFPGWDKK